MNTNMNTNMSMNRNRNSLATQTTASKKQVMTDFRSLINGRLVEGVDLIPDVLLPFGRLWYGEPNAIGNAIGYAQSFSRSHDAVIRVYDAAGNVIETHEHEGKFKEW